ncbi:MAG: MATE family efflux transporter [Oscillospiraceae bacterium]|nr:MATE family efflux transporter [Oscillospiraceae bacterium]MBO5324363.1 MATE family efflux transporter [Oscillospiraceae bacterium]
MFRKFIGDRAFYRHVLAIAIPIIIQNGITNFVSLLDNIMVGQVGTAPMSGVSIVNNLLFVFNMCVFGATSGAGIFTAQFHGCRDQEGIRHTFRFKLLICLVLTAASIGLFLTWGRDLILLYLQGEGDTSAIADSLHYGMGYLGIMLWGLPPFALSYAYSSTLRETNETVIPMIAGITAVFVNLALNYVLIFGKFGAPALGVNGAAIATVVSRYVELAIVALWTHRNSGTHPFITGAFRSVYIPGRLFRLISIKGFPLLVNEFFWSTGMAFLNQCYSIRGLDVVAAFTIATTISNLSSVVFMAMGNSVGIIMGQMLGAGASAGAVRDSNRKLIFVAVASCAVFGGLMAAVSGVFPLLYNTTSSVRSIATALILVTAAIMPFNAYTTSAYFTLRSGGKTAITFIFDSGFVWCIIVPLAFVLSRFTALPIVPLYAACQATDLIKCVLGRWMIKRGSWIQNLTT